MVTGTSSMGTNCQITRSSPVVNRDLEELSNVASQHCVPDGSEGYLASPAMINTVGSLQNSRANDSLRLGRLLLQMEDIIVKANDTLNAIRHWMAALRGQAIIDFGTYVNSTIQIPLTQHSGLSAEEVSRLHILLQFANYAFFLKKIENSTSSNISNVVLRELRLKIMQVICTFQKLLPPTINIKSYALQDLSGHIIPLENEKAGVKRALCYTAVENMLRTFMRVEISVSARTVSIRENLKR